MGKTNAIIEILVIGLITLFGIALNIMGFSNINQSLLSTYANDFKSYSNIFLLIVLALAYQLGWIVNGFTGQFYPKILRNKAKKKYNISLKDYPKVRNTVYLKASDNALLKIKERLSGIRLLRSSIVNILILIVALISLHYYILSISLFLLLILVFIITHHMYDKYTKQLIDTYQELDTENKNEKIIHSNNSE